MTRVEGRISVEGEANVVRYTDCGVRKLMIQMRDKHLDICFVIDGPLDFLEEVEDAVYWTYHGDE